MSSRVPACPDCGGPLPMPPSSGCAVCQLKMGLEWPSSDSQARSGEDATDPLLARAFGDYDVLHEVGRGGMGVIYKARHRPLGRIVALKVLTRGVLASDEGRNRFQTEAAALAKLSHSNIIAIHETGNEAGQPYHAMQFIAGESLREIVREQPLAPRRAAVYVRKIARAIHAAHEAGILHRDLKPSNILVDERDEPQVTDFGISTIDDGDDLTLAGQAFGTPSYMAPEQASSDSDRPLGPATDVYSLGALLYHLLVGRPPFHAERIEQTISQLLHHEPPAPRLILPSVPKDLETICLHCLEKRADKRYESAELLADDLQRFLDDKPIQAQPQSAWNRFIRWGSRNRPLAISLFTTLTLIVVGFGVAIGLWSRAKKASVARGLALERVELQRVEDLFRTERTQAAMALLARRVRDDPHGFIPAQRAVSCLTYRNFALPLGPILSHEEAITATEFSPDGSVLVTASKDQTVRLWEASTGRSLMAPLTHEGEVTQLDIDSSGTLLATASSDGFARVWEMTSGRELHRFKHEAAVLNVRIDTTGTRLASASGDQTACVWDLENGQRIHGPLLHGGVVYSCRFNRSGTQLLTASHDHHARLWNLQDPTQEPIRLTHEQRVVDARFSPDDASVATASWDGQPMLWESKSGRRLLRTPREDSWVTKVCWPPDGKTFVTTGPSGRAKLWNALTGEQIGATMQHFRSVDAMVIDPSGKRLATGSRDGAYLWDTETGALLQTIWHVDNVLSLEFSPDGRFLVVGSGNGQASVWQVLDGAAMGLTKQYADQVYGDWSPTENKIFAVCYDGDAWIYDADTLEPDVGPLAHPSILTHGDISQTGNHIMTTSREPRPSDGKRGGAVRVWDVRDGTLVAGPVYHERIIWWGAFGPTGTTVASASWDGTARVWDARTGMPITDPLPHGHGAHFVAYDPSGEKLITGSGDSEAKIWDIASSSLTTELPHSESVSRAEFSPDGSRVITASSDGTAQLWSASTGQALSPPLQHRNEVTRARFGPNGDLVVTTSLDAMARVWDGHTGRPIGIPMVMSGGITEASFSKDGKRVVTGSSDGKICVWDPRTGHAISEVMPTSGAVISTVFDPNNSRLLAADGGGGLRVWDMPLAPVPAPTWLPELLEAIVGERMDEDGRTHVIPPDRLSALRDRLLQETDQETFYGEWLHWFFADRHLRRRSPWAAPR